MLNVIPMLVMLYLASSVEAGSKHHTKTQDAPAPIPQQPPIIPPTVVIDPIPIDPVLIDTPTSTTSTVPTSTPAPIVTTHTPSQFNISITPDFLPRLVLADVAQFAVQISCATSIAINTETQTSGMSLISLASTFTVPGCTTRLGTFDSWSLLLYNPAGSVVSCGTYPGGGVASGDLVSQSISECPLLKIPLLPVAPITLPAKFGNSPYQGPTVLPGYAPPPIMITPIGKSYPVIQPVGKAYPIVQPVSKGNPIVQSTPIIQPGYVAPITKGYPVKQPAYIAPVGKGYPIIQSGPSGVLKATVKKRKCKRRTMLATSAKPLTVPVKRSYPLSI